MKLLLLLSFMGLLAWLVPEVWAGHMVFDPTIQPVHAHPQPVHWNDRRAFRSINYFSVQFVGSLPPSDVITAILYATTVLNTLFAPTVSITIGVEWTDLSSGNPNLLGMGGSYAVCLHPTIPNVLVPAALYSVLTGAPNCPGVLSPLHAALALNSHPPAPWYTGLGGTVPPTSIDLITVVLHEMIHGMGFESFMGASGTVGSAPAGFIYDCFLFANTANGWPYFGGEIGTPAMTDPSVLTSHVVFRGNVTAGNVSSFDVYTPSTFAPGTSLSHVKPSSSIINRLMFPALGFGQAWHNPGADVYVAMASMGYPMHPYVDLYNGATSYTANGCTTCAGARPESLLF